MLKEILETTTEETIAIIDATNASDEQLGIILSGDIPRNHAVFCGFSVGDIVSLRGENGRPPEKHLTNLRVKRIYSIVNDVAPHVRISAYSDEGVCMADAFVDDFIKTDNLGWSDQMAIAYTAGLRRKSVCPNDFQACYEEGLSHSL